MPYLLTSSEQSKKRTERAADSVTIGKVVERIAPSLPGFPLRSEDCRSLFEPIDYIVFRGLRSKGIVDAIEFVEVKSGKARLTPTQSGIRSLIERGKVSLYVAPHEASTTVDGDA